MTKVTNMSATEEMTAFVRVAELGSFAKAAEELRLSPSALSKLVGRLEKRLGAALMTRTTRRLWLTQEGTLYLQRAREVLDLIERAEQDVAAARARPRGHIRVNTGTAIAKFITGSAVPEFLATYPEITLDLTVTDRVIDPVAEHIDVALRTGPVAESELVVRKLTELKRVICAAPAYLQKYGTPNTPAELVGHNCLTLSSLPHLNAWPFQLGEGINRQQVSGSFSCDNVGILFDMALGGFGIIRLANFVVDRALRDGDLVELFADLHVSETVPMWAVMPPGRYRARRVQLFVDFMAERLR